MCILFLSSSLFVELTEERLETFPVEFNDLLGFDVLTAVNIPGRKVVSHLGTRVVQNIMTALVNCMTSHFKKCHFNIHRLENSASCLQKCMAQPPSVAISDSLLLRANT
jgi:hypothetical protein